MTWELDADHPYCAEHEAILKQSQKRFAKQIAANEAKLAARAKKARIIERKSPSGEVTYVIQQPHFLFRWWWVDAWCNQGPECKDSFSTLDEAECALPFFDGTPCKETVVVGGTKSSTQNADC